jgi:hypothetical protein
MYLDYISRQLALLEITNRLPDAGVQSDQLVHRTMDVFSAALTYVAVHISHESNQLGVIGSLQANGIVLIV